MDLKDVKAHAAPEVKLIIAGGRTFDDYKKLRNAVYRFMNYVENDMITIISGGARGADKLGEKFAKKHKAVKLEVFPAWWRGENGNEAYNNAAGYQRNVRMANAATHLLAFWDGESRGTHHMINIAKDKGLTVEVIRYANKAK